MSKSLPDKLYNFLFEELFNILFGSSEKNFHTAMVIISCIILVSALDLDDVSELLKSNFIIPIAFGFLIIFFGLRRARLIEDTPTAKIRSAPQGYVEISGRVKSLPNLNLISPLTKQECCWFEYQITRKSSRDIAGGESGSSDFRPFILQDETGSCLIYPESAGITTKHKTGWSDAKYNYSESLLLENDLLYAIGEFRTLDEIDNKVQSEELSRKIIMTDMEKNETSLLDEFDLNKDGHIDDAEWKIAENLASEWKVAEAAAVQREADDLAKTLQAYPNRLGSPVMKDNKYLLSNFSSAELADRYRYRAKLGLFYFFFWLVIIGINLST